MGWGARHERGISGAITRRTWKVATVTLLFGSMLHCQTALALADCSPAAAAASTADPGVGSRSASLHSVSLRAALHGTVGTPGTASSQAPCHRSGGTLVSMAS